MEEREVSKAQDKIQRLIGDIDPGEHAARFVSPSEQTKTCGCASGPVTNEAIDFPEFEPFDLDGDPDLDPEEVYKGLIEHGGFRFHAEIKQVDEEKRIIRGFANTKNIDRVGDIVEPSAFRKSLAAFSRRGKILWGHWGNGIGTAINAEIRDKGFFLEAQIGTGFDASGSFIASLEIEDAWNRIRQGINDAFSIGFQIIESESIPEADRPTQGFYTADRRIILLDLYEVSVVAIEANVQSTFNIVKAMQHGTDLWDRRKKCFQGICWTDDDRGGNKSEADYSEVTRYVASVTQDLDQAERELQEEITVMSAIERLRILNDELSEPAKTTEGGEN